MSARFSAARTTNDDADSPASPAACSICLRSADVSRASRRSALTATHSSLAMYKCAESALGRRVRVFLPPPSLAFRVLEQYRGYEHPSEERSASNVI
jgi:hypothetical protein